MKKPAIIASVAGAAVLALAGGVGIAQADKAVVLQVDQGPQQTVHTFGSTVGDALTKAGIEVGPRDQVVPSIDTVVSDGTQVLVRYGREVNVTIDGKQKTFWTTATTVDEALSQIGVREPETRLSVSRSAAVGREGLTFSAVTPKTVTVVADGRTTTANSTAATVSALLAERKLTVGKADKLTPAATTPLAEGLRVVVRRVTTKQVNETSALAHPARRVETNVLEKGTEKVSTPGVDGVATKTFTVTYVDGKASGKKLVATKVTKKPIAEVVLVGTKPKPVVQKTEESSSSSSKSSDETKSSSSSGSSGGGLNLARAGMWDRIAQCESTGNWHTNTGNGYYGGLQFDRQTWLAAGGGRFAPRADLASREQQITIANALYAERGLQPWGCAHAA